jgi:uncharacterized Zn-binding protein involved in type VI secretion
MGNCQALLAVADQCQVGLPLPRVKVGRLQNLHDLDALLLSSLPRNQDMTAKPVARVGDTGSHGGAITTGSNTVFVNDKPMARVGDTYACPKHGPNPIVTGAPSVFGQRQLVAHVGSKTACGAIITSGSPDTFVDAPVSGNSEDVACIGSGDFSEQFRLVDESTGEPVIGVAYRIRTQSGLVHEGKTDDDGKTVRVYTKEAEEVECALL